MFYVTLRYSICRNVAYSIVMKVLACMWSYIFCSYVLVLTFSVILLYRHLLDIVTKLSDVKVQTLVICGCHCVVLDIFPVVFEGGKLVVNKGLSSHFQISHTMTMSSLQPSGYKFGCTYVGTKQYSPSEASRVNVTTCFKDTSKQRVTR